MPTPVLQLAYILKIFGRGDGPSGLTTDLTYLCITQEFCFTVHSEAHKYTIAHRRVGDIWELKVFAPSNEMFC